MVYLNLTLITLVVVFVVDLSGWTQSWKAWLQRWLTAYDPSRKVGRVRPFDCSLCTTFWIGIIYLLLAREFTLPHFAYLALCAWLTKQIYGLMDAVYNFIGGLIHKLNNIIDRLWQN